MWLFADHTPDAASDAAIYRVWMSVGMWISPGLAEKLHEFQGGRAMNVSIWSFMANLASSTGSGITTRRLCVVSRSPLMSGVFLAGLTTAVGARDELEIIVDRRQGDAAASRPSVERRHRDHVVRALERDGFAFVLVPARETHDGPGSKRPPWPVERVPPEETYEHKLERLLWSKQARIVRLSRWLIISVLINGIAIGFTVSSALKARWSPPRPASSVVAPAANVDEPVAPRTEQP